MNAHKAIVAGTTSTTGKMSYHPPNASQMQEKKSLLVDPLSTPIKPDTVDETEFIVRKSSTDY
jgi:hypothetical protein